MLIPWTSYSSAKLLSLGRIQRHAGLVASTSLRYNISMSFLLSSPFSGYSSSNRSLNRSLAWSMGSRGVGRFHVKFPLQPDWYNEQPCKTFKSLEHRKERIGFRHEYIVLNLDNDAICILERMGDADARFDAILPQGSTAHDYAQVFQPENLSEACLHSSDVIARITFPDTLDLKDALKVCRAIQEGDKTCNYTLQSFNCYFFCLAIQSTLSRQVADWRDRYSNYLWRETANSAMVLLSKNDQSQLPTGSGQPVLLRIFSLTNTHTERPMQIIAHKMQDVLDSPAVLEHMNSALRSTLWYCELGLAVDYVLEGRTRDTIMHALNDSLATVSEQPSPSTHSVHAVVSAEVPSNYLNPPPIAEDQSLNILLNRLKNALVTLVSVAASSHSSQPRTPRHMRPKEYVTYMPQPSRSAEATEMDFRPYHNPNAGGTNVEQSLLKCVTVFIAYARNVVLWCFLAVKLWLNVCRPFFQSLSINDELVSMLDQVGNPSQARLVVLATALDRVNDLITNGDAHHWNEMPWTCIQENIKEQLLSPLYYQEAARLEVTFPNEDAPQSMKVSTFQRHLRSRIDEQASLVERGWLGTANNISRELQENLSQVWVLGRNDATEMFEPGLFFAVYFELYDPRKQREMPLDALGQWQDKSRAKVEWHFDMKRLPKNRVVHFAIPILTCYRHYGTKDLQDIVLLQAAGHPSAAKQNFEEAAQNWFRQRGETSYRLKYGEHDGQQFSTDHIKCVSHLNRLPIMGCRGEGYTQKDAKRAAARLLFNAGYCTYYGRFRSRPRNMIHETFDIGSDGFSPL